MLIRIILLFLLSYLLPVQKAMASTSCAGAQTILGFSKDWKQMYWDQEIAGECVSGNILHVFDFEKNQGHVISSFQDDENPSDKQRYRTSHRKIKNTTVFPSKNKIQKITTDICDFEEGIGLPKDSYVGGVEAIKTIYLNPKFQRWVVITEECNAGDSVGAGGSCTYNAIYILPKKSCAIIQN